VLGLALGVRVDLAPLALLAVGLERGARTRFAVGLVAALAVWLPGFALALPPEGYSAALGFARGHFLVWGSSALAGAGGEGAARGLVLALGGPLFAGASAWGTRRAPAHLRNALFLGLAPYAAWVLLGQNLASPRHLLPLAPALALTAAHALALAGSTRARGAWTAALLASLLATGVLAAAPHPDGRALAARVSAVCGDCAAIFGGPEVRLLEHYGVSGVPTYRRATVDEVRRDVAAWSELGGAIGITSALANSGELRARPIRIGEGLLLYRIEAAELRYTP
jgi:hypothetical protein